MRIEQNVDDLAILANIASTARVIYLSFPAALEGRRVVLVFELVRTQMALIHLLEKVIFLAC